jgi:FHA domain/Double zinc ribbon
MPACPNGHVSTDPDYCDTCGTPLGAAPSPSTGTPASSSGSAASNSPGSGSSSSAPSGPAAMTACPSCGESNAESNLFCESCGLDFVTGQAPPPIVTAAAVLVPAAPSVAIDPGRDLGWVANLAVDTAWFAVKGEGIGTPPTRGVKDVPLFHVKAVVGRSRSAGAQPGIIVDDDHGISRQHAEFHYDEVGDAWSVTDLSSTNGTFVLAEDAVPTAELEPIPPGVARPLIAGERVHLGAWTLITLTKSTVTKSTVTNTPSPSPP